MISIVTTSAVSFAQLQQDTILNAAEKSSVVLAYSCRTGRCSTCKCKVISGDTVPLVDEPDGAPRKLMDGIKLGSLGWRPSLTLKDALVDAFRWYLANLSLARR
jgi:CDP-4-dehydro-6-deoxyglucose reductase